MFRNSNLTTNMIMKPVVYDITDVDLLLLNHTNIAVSRNSLMKFPLQQVFASEVKGTGKKLISTTVVDKAMFHL